MKKKIIEKFTSYDLLQKLQYRLSDAGWVILPQVRSGTGFLQRVRTADAIAMSTWPSRGLELHGFEIKITRSDWLSELKNPGKAEKIAQFCDRWWIVAPKDIIKVEEIPTNWGLYVPYRDTLKVVKEAKKLDAIPINRLFLAAILRKAQDVVVPKAALKAEFDAGKKYGQTLGEDKMKWDKKSYESFKDKVIEFEQASGVKIDGWQGPKEIGEAVKMVLNGEPKRVKDRLRGLLSIAENIVESTKGYLEKID